MRVLLLLIALVGGFTTAATPPAKWPQWRGPFNTGMAEGDAPLLWDGSRNVRWKLAIPGRGHSTPVIAGNHIFLTTAVPAGKVIRPDRKSVV